MYDLHETARALVAPGKGILAEDESPRTADARLAEHGIATGTEMRRKYREVFLDVPGIEASLAGVILCEETLGQAADDGTLFPELLARKGILPGIKVDAGTEPLDGSPDELITKGLIGLDERLASFRAAGARFTKWRAVMRIEGDRLPTARALVENAKRLASYAHLVQQAGMVPILEPEVLLDGSHSRLRAQEVIDAALHAVFAAMADQAVDRTALLVKTSMALSGSGSSRTDAPDEVAESTLDALKASVPADVPGIVFLSGGQTPEQATENLAAITRRAREAGAPWPLTFSYERALHSEGMDAWKGKDENIPAARAAFLARLSRVTAALTA